MKKEQWGKLKNIKHWRRRNKRNVSRWAGSVQDHQDLNYYFKIKSSCPIKTFEKVSYPKIIFKKCLSKVFIGDFSKSFQVEFQEFGWDLTWPCVAFPLSHAINITEAITKELVTKTIKCQRFLIKYDWMSWTKAILVFLKAEIDPTFPPLLRDESIFLDVVDSACVVKKRAKLLKGLFSQEEEARRCQYFDAVTSKSGNWQSRWCWDVNIQAPQSASSFLYHTQGSQLAKFSRWVHQVIPQELRLVLTHLALSISP